jgi:hypothetical protein
MRPSGTPTAEVRLPQGASMSHKTSWHPLARRGRHMLAKKAPDLRWSPLTESNRRTFSLPSTTPPVHCPVEVAGQPHPAGKLLPWLATGSEMCGCETRAVLGGRRLKEPACSVPRQSVRRTAGQSRPGRRSDDLATVAAQPGMPCSPGAASIVRRIRTPCPLRASRRQVPADDNRMSLAPPKIRPLGT